MTLKISYPKKDDIPSGYEDLYTEKNGVWMLTGVEGLKTQEDVSKISSALDLEKKQHSETKKKWAAVTALNVGPEEVLQRLEEVEDLRIKVEAVGGKDVEAKINEAVQKKVEREHAKWEREKKQLIERAETAEGKTTNLQGEINRSKIESEVRKSATDLRIRPEAVQDALILAERVMVVNEDGTIQTKDQVGYTPGLNIKEFLEDRKNDRVHWWEPSNGGGSRTPSGVPKGVNPWKKETRNLTQQAKLFKENPDLARQMASEVGATILE